MPTQIVNNSTPVIVAMLGDPPYSLGVDPGGGCTCLIELQLVETGQWYPWTLGLVTSKAAQTVLGPCNAFRFTRTIGSVPCSFEYR